MSGAAVNSVTPGGHIGTSENDRFGNTVRELTAANRSLALGLTVTDRAAQAELGIAQLTVAERAELLSTRRIYNTDGTRKLEEFGPLHRLDLTTDLKSGTTTLVSAGTSVIGRSWAVNAYDEGARRTAPPPSRTRSRARPPASRCVNTPRTRARSG